MLLDVPRNPRGPMLTWLMPFSPEAAREGGLFPFTNHDQTQTKAMALRKTTRRIRRRLRGPERWLIAAQLVVALTSIGAVVILKAL